MSDHNADECKRFAGELWAVHAQGPDDIYPAFDRADAERHAAELNAIPTPAGVSVAAVVIPSPMSPLEHWKELAEQEREHKAQVIASAAQPAPVVPEGWRLVMAIELAEEKHGSLRAAARALGIDAGYLSRLKKGEKVNPSEEVLAALGLERMTMYRASQQCTQSSWVPDGWQLVPKEPTAEMIEALAASFWPADWEAGKRLQRLRGTKVVFPKTEIEMAVGKYERVLSAAPAQPAAQGEFGDAYQGAREDLAIWKRRALEAEEKLRAQCDDQSFMGEPLVQPYEAPREKIEALFKQLGFNGQVSVGEILDAALSALKAQQVGQEPVAWSLTLPDGRVVLEKAYPHWIDGDMGGDGYSAAPLYTAPQPAPAQDVAERWTVACGDWRETLLAIHGERTGHIASGVPESAAHAIVKAHNAGLPELPAAHDKQSGEVKP